MADTDHVPCSIVIPLFNKKRFIGASLASVLAQSFRDFEVVVVDDGSTDGSAAVVQSIADPRIRLLKQANAGVSAARNAGITHARGALVFFFDADDWMHEDYLLTQVDQATKHPQVVFFAARFLRFDADLAAPVPWSVPAQASSHIVVDLPTAWRQGQTFITSAVAVRRSTLLAMQPCFPLGESNGEDMDLWFRLAEANSLCLTDAPLIGYREGSLGSLSIQHKDALFPPFLNRMEQRARSGRLTKALAGSMLRFVAEARTTQARVLLTQGYRSAAARSLWQASAAAGRPRWWLSWLMVFTFPAIAVYRWEQSRISRTQARL